MLSRPKGVLNRNAPPYTPNATLTVVLCFEHNLFPIASPGDAVSLSSCSAQKCAIIFFCHRCANCKRINKSTQRVVARRESREGVKCKRNATPANTTEQNRTQQNAAHITDGIVDVDVDASSSFIIMQNVLPGWHPFKFTSHSAANTSPHSPFRNSPCRRSYSGFGGAVALAAPMQQPELSQHLVFIVVLLSLDSGCCVCGHCGCKLYAQHYFT